MQIITSGNTLTMSSREIAELTGKRHDHVKRDIEKMLTELERDIPSFGGIYLDSRGREQVEYHLNRELTETLITGYSIKLRHKVILRLRELESSQPINVPRTYAAALLEAGRLAQLAEEQAELLAIAAPKVEFVDRYVENTGTMTFRQVAKLLKANERHLRQLLIDGHVMYRLNGVMTPYQNHIDAGRFEVKTGTSERNNHAFAQARFTPKGVQWIAGLWASRSMQEAA